MCIQLLETCLNTQGNRNVIHKWLFKTASQGSYKGILSYRISFGTARSAQRQYLSRFIPFTVCVLDHFLETFRY